MAQSPKASQGGASLSSKVQPLSMITASYKYGLKLSSLTMEVEACHSLDCLKRWQSYHTSWHMHHHPHRFKWVCYKKWNGKPRLASIIWRWDAWKDEVLDDFPSKDEKGPSSIRWSLKLKGNIGKTDERQVVPWKTTTTKTRSHNTASQGTSLVTS